MQTSTNLNQSTDSIKARLLLQTHYLEWENSGFWLSTMGFNHNSNSSLKSEETKNVSFRVSLINRVLKPITIPPQTLAKKK